MATAGARKNFASLVRRSAAGERIKLTRYNKTVAIMIPKKDLETLVDCETKLEAEQPEAEQPDAEQPTAKRTAAARSRRTRVKAKPTR